MLIFELPDTAFGSPLAEMIFHLCSLNSSGNRFENKTKRSTFKCGDDCSIILAFKVDCRPSYDSSIEAEAHCSVLLGQGGVPSRRPAHALGSPVPCLGLMGALGP